MNFIKLIGNEEIDGNTMSKCLIFRMQKIMNEVTEKWDRCKKKPFVSGKAF
jgi:hypothetical protein